MKKNLIYYLSILLTAFLLKLAYVFITVEQTRFILTPTSFLVELVTNSPGFFSAETGYHHPALNIVIDKSCSGFNFWIICFSMLGFLLLRFAGTTKQKLFIVPSALMLSYVFTVFANTSRILFSMFGSSFIRRILGNEPSWFHQAQGAFVYMFLLIMIYMFIEFKLKKNEKIASA